MSSIDQRLPASGRDGFQTINPSTGQPLAMIPMGTPADANRAVCLAREAHAKGVWRLAAPSARAEVLNTFADLITQNAGQLDALDAEDMGKPVSLRLFNAASAASLMRYCATAAGSLAGQVLASDHQSHVTWHWVPRGVVAAIVPWNFPTYNAVMKLAPALATGNCVILKPSEYSTHSAVLLAELGRRAGLPAGVLTTLLGLGKTVGEALGLHGAVDMISFTGSTEVGRLMLQYAGRSNMKTVVAECGGKSPQIVFDDGVDLDAAADWVAGLLLTNQGQVCSVGSRLLVQRSIEEEFTRRIAERMGQVTIGNALDAATSFGPLASKRQLERVIGFIEGALEEGARLIRGGGRILPASGGYFVEPTLFSHVDPASRLAQQEVFGPVLAVIPFDTEEEAIQLANGTGYGLAAYAWTAQFARAMRMRNIHSSAWIYAGRPTGEGAGHAATLEPYGQSGIGVEGGLPGLQSYMRRQTLSFHFG